MVICKACDTLATELEFVYQRLKTADEKHQTRVEELQAEISRCLHDALQLREQKGLLAQRIKTLEARVQELEIRSSN